MVSLLFEPLGYVEFQNIYCVVNNAQYGYN